ncbi:MAG TPA: hypothetical protein VIY48_13020 [Candidatus Paceibacterota bacterium]
MPLAAGLALALSAALAPAQGLAAAAPTPVQAPAAQTVRQYVESQFADTPVMIKIASCESQFRQFDTDGDVLQNPHSTAIGVFQIMASIHKDLADQNLGLDITTLEGNVAYAKALYKDQGTTPWNASKACWAPKSDKVATAAK